MSRTSAVTSALLGYRSVHGRAKRQPRPLAEVPSAGFALVSAIVVALPLLVVVIGTSAALLLTYTSGTRLDVAVCARERWRPSDVGDEGALSARLHEAPFVLHVYVALIELQELFARGAKKKTQRWRIYF